MKLIKISYENSKGEELAGRLDLPADKKPHNYAVFAHCFTCNKNIAAVKNISRALTSNGFGVLRFDFTGLGESEGDFENTDFSANVDDLITITRKFGRDYEDPTLMIGHSLGGAAAIFASEKLSEIKAVATIGAPSNPGHVKKLLSSGIDEIKEKGFADITLAGRKFTIKKQFLDDLENKDLPYVAAKFEKSLLVMHSPEDNVVGIDNAAEIYKAAKHPKSFISMQGADHLLSKKVDSLYAGNTIANWALRYIKTPEQKELKTNMQIVANLGGDKYTTQIQAGKHSFIADEPEKVGGNDFGPNPYDLLASSLGACTAMTIKMYAERKKWDIEEVEVHVQHSKDHAEDCNKCENSKDSKIDKFERIIELKGALDQKQKDRLIEIADKCPVHKTLHNDIEVKTFLK